MVLIANLYIIYTLYMSKVSGSSVNIKEMGQ